VWDRQIQNAVDAGDGDYQLRALRERVAADPAAIQPRLDLAQAYSDRGYYEVALEICRLAAERFPESGPVRLALTRALRGTNRRAEAIDGLENFLKTHPQEASEYFSWLGILRDESNLWPAGEPAHRKAVELAPASDSLHNNLGYNLLMQEKPAEAAAEFHEALRLNPRSELARNNLGLALAREGAAAEAIAAWQAITDPATAHSNLAVVLIEKGNYAEARKELEIALGYNKSHTAALKNLELVSRLDGHPATLALKPAESRWARMKSGFRGLFVGRLKDSGAKAGKSASAPLTGEEQ
jgi:tetratricopeptide (TPR) repeat protein